ncbi:MAG: hypothetical protein ACJ790_08725 [Myxococcaceae bacterium]
MAAWGRAVLAAVLVVLPGGLVIALAWALSRAVAKARQDALQKSQGGPVGAREVWRELRFSPSRLAPRIREAVTPRA